MAWIEHKINALQNIKVHFTPEENIDLIRKNGILLPAEARKIVGHVSPYDKFATTKKYQMPNEIKDEFTYFGTYYNNNLSIEKLIQHFLS